MTYSKCDIKRDLRNKTIFQVCSTNEYHCTEPMTERETCEYLKTWLSRFMVVFQGGIWHHFYDEESYLNDLQTNKEKILRSGTLPDICLYNSFIEPPMSKVMALLGNSSYVPPEPEEKMPATIDELISWLFEGNRLHTCAYSEPFQLWITTPDEETSLQNKVAEIWIEMHREVDSGLYDDIEDTPQYKKYMSFGAEVPEWADEIARPELYCDKPCNV